MLALTQNMCAGVDIRRKRTIGLALEQNLAIFRRWYQIRRRPLFDAVWGLPWDRWLVGL